MSNRYVIKFTKDGYIKYTSHLDMLRMFKRAFKKTGITLGYSQGFNPHPKMGFAQPLSLGYSSSYELIEFETAQKHTTEDIFSRLEGQMPEGITMVSCVYLDEKIKSLAADADSAEYKIWIPSALSEETLKAELTKYLEQEDITALKRTKKSKKPEPVSIRHMIRSLDITKTGEFAVINALLDCGSRSNCSPELVIASFIESSGMDVQRYEIEVERTKINFVNNLQF